MSHPKKANNRGKTPTKNTQKAFALSTFLASTLKTYPNKSEPKLAQIVIQSNRLMNVYANQFGALHFNELTVKLGDIWDYLLTRNENNSIVEDDIPILIEYICMLIPPTDFEKMFSMQPYKTDKQTDCKVYAIIAMNVLELDKELNKLLGTKAYALTKPVIKETKMKKERDKPKNKTVKEKKVSANKVKAAAKKKAHKQKILSLKEIIAKAKQKYVTTEDS